jgi:ArsR family transcriptional regulator
MAAEFAALSDPTRLRMLRVCRAQALQVGEFVRVLGLPEPAVSRHLAVLARAGWLARSRAGRIVQYRWAPQADNSRWLAAALESLDESAAELRRDGRRLARIAAGAADAFTAQSPFGARLAGLWREQLGAAVAPSALGIGVRHGEVLRWLSGQAAQLHLTEHDAHRRTEIALFARAAGIEFQWSRDATGANQHDLACVVALDLESLTNEVADAARRLRDGGRLLLAVPYDLLDQAAGLGGPHPLFRLRALLTRCGLACQRLEPLEADGQHWLLAWGGGQAAGDSGRQHSA